LLIKAKFFNITIMNTLCKDLNLRPCPARGWTLAQEAQNNKFVEKWVKILDFS